MGQQKDDLPRLYTAGEVADALRCSEWWVKEQVRRRRIPFIRSGGSYRFTREHVEEALHLLEERPTQPPNRATEGRRTPPKTTGTVTQLRARRPSRSRNVA